jgi:hypothetical protein
VNKVKQRHKIKNGNKTYETFKIIEETFQKAREPYFAQDEKFIPG